jgi:hypothetical protein
MRWTSELLTVAATQRAAGREYNEIGAALGCSGEAVRTALRDRRLGATADYPVANKVISVVIAQPAVIRSVAEPSVQEHPSNEFMGRIGRRVAHIGDKRPGRHYMLHVTDLHAGSKWADMLALREFLLQGKTLPIDGVLVTGDNIDGVSEKLVPEQRAYGLEDQQAELVDVFASVELDVPVWSISGNHDGYCDHAAGMESGRVLTDRMRERGVEWNYLGQCLGRVVIHGAKIELWHGSGGAGTRNAVRRVLNHRAESYKGEDTPHVLLVGHYHRYAQFVAIPENVLCVSGATFQRKRTEFANRIAHPWDIGGGILSWTVRADGSVGEFAYEFVPAKHSDLFGWAA